MDAILEDSLQNIVNNNFNKPLNDLLSIVENDPDNIEANKLLGASLLAINKPDVADVFLYKAVKLTAWTDVAAVSNLVESLRLNKDYELGLHAAAYGLKVASDAGKTAETSLLWYQMASMHASLGNYSTAADYFLTSVSIDSTNIQAWIRASTLQFPEKHRDLLVASRVLLRGVRSNPENTLVILSWCCVIFAR